MGPITKEEQIQEWIRYYAGLPYDDDIQVRLRGLVRDVIENQPPPPAKPLTYPEIEFAVADRLVCSTPEPEEVND